MPTDADREAHNARFVQRLLARRKDALDRHADVLRVKIGREESLGGADPLAGRPVLETLQDPVLVSAATRREVLETIVNRERPVLFVQNDRFNTTGVTALGAEAEELVGRMRTSAGELVPLLPLVGRFDVTNFPNTDFIGTGWFVADDVVVTNRHVASLVAEHDGREFVFRRGVGGQPMTAAVCNAHEFDDPVPPADRVFAVRKVLYIAPPDGPDMAFVRVARPAGGAGPRFIPIAPADAADNDLVCVVGYPARAPRSVIPNQQLMSDLYQGRFDVKRAAPGFSMGTAGRSAEHDCTTLGGNSGSVLLDFRGRAVGLHFAGLYEQANFAVPASVLRDFIDRRRWEPAVIDLPPTPPPVPVETPAPAPTLHAPAGGHTITVTIPVTITIEVGAPTTAPHPPGGPQRANPPKAVEVAAVEAALVPYWDTKPEGVVAARVGFTADDPPRPFLAASVAPDRWAGLRDGGPAEFHGVPVRYLPATVDEQIAARPDLEAVSAISYDDDARKGKKFSFDPVDEEMELLLHVGPEFSWDTLKGFLAGAKKELVAAMYEFHATHIKDAIQERLKDEVEMQLVLDNTTFGGHTDEDGRFDPVAVFKGWADSFAFERVVVPEGASGLIANAYHIKVTVRDQDTFWLSSGNWKAGSSQPQISQAQRDAAATTDLPGNREWHVVVTNKTLAGRYRNHILQDMKRSLALGGGELPASRQDESFLDLPLHEAVTLERRPAARLIPPKPLRKKVKVRPLLTPDQQGGVFSHAVLDLIRSARKSLLFQIPYIAMPSNPRADRGFIDQLIAALVDKLKSLPDARVILRTGGSKFSSPTHAAWFFKSKGVDIDGRLRAIENHHTKGMIVDGKRVLLGSHNWSQPGVSLNRDASLLFDDAEVASYYAEAFEVDWARSNPVRPKKFVRETVAGLSVAAPEFRQVTLSDWLADD